MCLGPHPLSVEPQYPELSLGPTFLPVTYFCLILGVIDSWMEDPLPNLRLQRFLVDTTSHWASQGPTPYSPQKTANTDWPMLTEGPSVWSQISAPSKRDDITEILDMTVLNIHIVP